MKEYLPVIVLLVGMLIIVWVSSQGSQGRYQITSTGNGPFVVSRLDKKTGKVENCLVKDRSDSAPEWCGIVLTP